MEQLGELKKILQDNKQEHLLRFYEKFDDKQKGEYVNKLLQMDFKSFTTLFQKAIEPNAIDNNMKPIPKKQIESESNCKNLNKYYSKGLHEISKGNVGVLLMAGGQGTRLGISYPKGMYDIGLLSKKTLLQLQAERIRKAEELAGNSGKITWYVMTSDCTYQETKIFLEQNHYFGLNKQDVVIFKQGLSPCFDFNGHILMDAKDNIAFAPNGNGGIYTALKTNGILNDFKKRGVKYLHVHGVDNILVKVADPTFIGYCVEKGADCGAKVVQKLNPDEPIGVVCLLNNRYQVVEYSEITDMDANLKNPDGTLVYNSGNICNHFFSTNFLELLVDKEIKLHVAKKKIPYINDEGNLIVPKSPNGFKIEKFVFDVFEYSQNFVVWEVNRENEFSAMKNADVAGVDCPMTAKRDLYNLHKIYLENAGAIVEGEEVEISPLRSYSGEGLDISYNGKTIIAPNLIE